MRVVSILVALAVAGCDPEPSAPAAAPAQGAAEAAEAGDSGAVEKEDDFFLSDVDPEDIVEYDSSARPADARARSHSQVCMQTYYAEYTCTSYFQYCYTEIYTQTVCFPDVDHDGHGAGYNDCDDNNAARFYGNVESCDDLDNDCDNSVDEGLATSPFYPDADGDGYGRVGSTAVQDCARPAGYAANAQDCVDTNDTIRPGAAEGVADGTDQNCDGRELCWADADGDGYGSSGTQATDEDMSCDAAGNASTSGVNTDCNDGSSAFRPGAADTVGDEVDHNCDSREVCYTDADGDGRRGTGTVLSTADTTCRASGEALVTAPLDCGNGAADNNGAIYPGNADATGDNVDSNCDGSEVCYADADGDGRRSTSTKLSSGNTVCTDNGEAEASDPLDCNGGGTDNNGAIYPGAVEGIGDGTDQNCDGAETCYADGDQDGYRGAGTVASITDFDCNDSGEALAATALDCTNGAGDSSSAVNPGASEKAGDEIDQNCDGAEICYVDADDDGYRLVSTKGSTDVDCDDSGEAASSEPLDCGGGTTLDDDKNIHPGRAEVCNQIDDDCDSSTDEGLPTVTYYRDADSDGYGDDENGTKVQCNTGAPPAGYLADDLDCEDDDGAIHPGASEIAYDGVDQDCAGGDLDDVDKDGYASDAVAGGDDCHDGNAQIHPGVTETIDGVDQDCDGDVDDGTVAFDDDGDGYTENGGDCDDARSDISPVGVEICDGDDQDCDDELDENTSCTDDDFDGYTEDDGDCDDGNPEVSPGTLESKDAGNVENGLDDDCDGSVDEGGAADPDADGYTDAAGDCDQTDKTVYPDAPELEDGKDNDCDEIVDDGTDVYDDDGDGFTEDEGDCDDGDDTISPEGAETEDGVDEDCDGDVDDGTDAFDDDDDGYTEDGGDCDDAEPAVNPGADELLNQVDDDCDDEVDEGFTDEDGDGLAVEDGDCDDGDAGVYLGAGETCDGVDEDCDGEVDEGVECEGGGGCGCASGGGGLAGVWVVLVGLVVGRRRR